MVLLLLYAIGCSTQSPPIVQPPPPKAYYYHLTPKRGGTSAIVGPWRTLAACRDNLGSAFYSHPETCHRTGPHPPANCANIGSGYAYPKGAGLNPAWRIPDLDCTLMPVVHTGQYGQWIRFWYSADGVPTVVIKGQKPPTGAGSFTYYADSQCPGWPWIYVGDSGAPGGDGVCN